VLEKSSRRNVDFLVVGAGVVGCAMARELAMRGRSVVLLDRDASEGRGITSRNSGVVHSGIFGKQGTRKQRSCIEGRKLLYAFAAERGVAHRQCGKLILAQDDDEQVESLENYFARAQEAKVNVERVSQKRALTLEPALEGASFASALYVPDAGIVDAHALCSALLAEAKEHGAFFAPQAPVTAIEITKDRAVVRSGRGPIDTQHVVNAAGLHADEIAQMVGLRRPVLPCRGDYFHLRRARPYSRLIYPVSSPGDAGLGIHLTVGLDGRARLGPDTQWVSEKNDFTPAPNKLPIFLNAAQRLLGDSITADQLSYDGCGIRPKRHSPVEDPVDFEILATPRCIHMLGIESPGLTSAMSLAREVASHLVKLYA
jgi:L-2-hydroxyglutarate oxidase LhgO